MRKPVLILGVAVLLSFGLAASADTLSGTMTNSDVEDGANAYMKLVAGDGTCADPGPGLHAVQAVFKASTATYELPGVSAGGYMGCFFIDSDNNIMETGGPTSGDWGAMKAVTVEGETTLNVAETEWMQIP